MKKAIRTEVNAVCEDAWNTLNFVKEDFPPAMQKRIQAAKKLAVTW